MTPQMEETLEKWESGYIIESLEVFLQAGEVKDPLVQAIATVAKMQLKPAAEPAPAPAPAHLASPAPAPAPAPGPAPAPAAAPGAPSKRSLKELAGGFAKRPRV